MAGNLVKMQILSLSGAEQGVLNVVRFPGLC